MKINKRYGLLFLFFVGSFLMLYGQEKKKVVFPVSIVIFGATDTIYCFEDSLSNETILRKINTEEEFVKFLKSKLEIANELDTNTYYPMIRFYAVPMNLQNNFLAWDRVFKYDSKLERKRIGFWKRDDEENVEILKLIFKKTIK